MAKLLIGAIDIIELPSTFERSEEGALVPMPRDTAIDMIKDFLNNFAEVGWDLVQIVDIPVAGENDGDFYGTPTKMLKTAILRKVREV